MPTSLPRPTLLALGATAVLALAGCPSTTPSTPTTPIVAPDDPVPPKPAPPMLDAATKERLDELIMAMYVDDIAIRRDAAEELGTMGSDGRGALPELIQCAGTDEPDDEPVAVCAHSIVAIASGDAPLAMDALVHAFQISIDVKERALTSLGELGGLASPALAAIYLDACERMDAASRPLGTHLEQTAAAAVSAMAQAPASARAILLDAETGACGERGATAVSAVAQR